MSDSIIENKSRLVLLTAILLAVPLGISTVTLGSGTIIEQAGNNVDIVVESEFNVSELEVYDSATEFGDTNFTVEHDDPGLVQVNMTKFNSSVPQGDYVTDFKANASSGTTIDFKFSNLTENQYFVFRKNGNKVGNTSTSSSGNVAYSVSYSSYGFDDYSLEASARDTPDVSVNLNKSEAYNQSETIGVTGTVTRQSTGTPIEDANVTLYRKGEKVITNLLTDSNGEFNSDVNSQGDWSEPHSTAPNCGTVTYDGSGTNTDPYKVKNDHQLQCIENKDLSAHYEVTQNIDASKTNQWNTGNGFNPVGDSSNRFTGSLDGNGYTVDGLYIDRGSTDYVGLIGLLSSSGSVQNIGVTNVDITGDGFVGGLIGTNDGSVSDSYSTGTVTGNGVVGGLIGDNFEGSVSDSYSTGTVTGNSGQVGGLIGDNDQGSVDNSYSTGTVTGNFEVGGLIGNNDGGSVSDSYWDTESSGQTSSAGGTGLTTSEMQGTSATTNMNALDFNNKWNTVEASEGDATTDGYPILQDLSREKQLEAQGIYAGPNQEATVFQSLDVGEEAGEFEIRAEAEKAGISADASTTYSVGTIFLEDAKVSGNNFIDVDDTPNASVKAYKNNQNPVEVDFRVNSPLSGVLNTGDAENTAVKTETQRWYHEVLDWGLGEFSVEFFAESQLNGDTISEFESVEASFVVQNISLDLNTDRESYGIGSGQQVDVSGSAILKDNDTAVSGETVNIDVVNTTSGNILDSYTATTDGSGDFSTSYSFTPEAGVRKLNASIENSNGIEGEADKTYSVTNMELYSIGFSDISDLHGYNVTGFISDSTGINNPGDYSCEFNVSDGDGNYEIYTQGINESFGDGQQATCTQPYVASTNNTGWDHLEDLTTDITLTRNSVKTSSTASRQLPNNAPEIIEDTEISLKFTESTFRYTVNASARDGDIPGSNEINNCYITYIGDDRLSRQVEGTLGKSYGGPEEAYCEASFDTGNSSISRGELIEARVNFNDTHGDKGRSTMVSGPVAFEVETRDFGEDPVQATFNITDSETGKELKVVDTGADGEYLGYVPRGTHDVKISALGSEAVLRGMELNSAQDLLLEVDDNLDSEVNKSFIRDNLYHIAYETSGFTYDAAEVNLDYIESVEKEVSGWYCNNFNSSIISKECIDSYSEPNYDLDADKNIMTLKTSSLEGGFALADSSFWREVWDIRKVVNIEGSERDLKNYQVQLALNTSEMLVNDALASDCSNIRFTSTSQAETIDHWLKPGECGKEDAEVWIEVPYIPANSTRSIYIYSGKEDLSDVSSGRSTFLDFDEFNSGLSGYSTTGDVVQRSGRVNLRSDNGNEASIKYTDTTRDPPYRFMTTFTPSGNAENSSVNTLVNSTDDSLGLNTTENVFYSDYSSTNKALQLPDEELDIDTNITENEQSVESRYSGNIDSATISKSVTGEEQYPFRARILETSGTPSDQTIERWFTAKYTNGTVRNSIKSLKKAWTLNINGPVETRYDDGDVQVFSGVDIEIELSSNGGRTSDYTGYINDEQEFSGVDTQTATFNENFSEKRYHEVRFEVEGFSRSLIRDIIVGDDNQAPNLSVTGVTQADNSIDIKFDVNDNYLGDIECEALVDGVARSKKRVPNSDTTKNRSAELSLSSLNEGDSGIGVRCSDQTGNSESEFFADDVDLSGPQIEVETPRDGGSQLRVRPRLEINMTDQSSQELDYSISYSDSSITKTGTIQNNTLSEVLMKAPNKYGEKTIGITGTDKNGFSSTEYITLDLTKPYVNISAPEPDTSEPSTGMFGNPYTKVSAERIESLDGNETFTYNYTTEARSNSKCHLEVDGKTYNTTNINVNQTEEISAFNIDEAYDVPVKVKCNTEAGTNISKEMKISIDRTKPNFTILKQGAWENNTDYTEGAKYQLKLFTEDNHQTNRYVKCDWYGDCWTEADSHPYLEIDDQYGHIMIRHNFTGPMQNTSIQCNTERWSTDDPPPSGTECRDSYTINNDSIGGMRGLDAGVYDYKIWVRDDVGNVRQTDTRRFVIDKEEAGVNLNVKDRAQKGYIINGTSPRLRCSVKYQESSLVLDRNGVEIDSSTTTEVNDLSQLDVPDTYNYNCSIGGTGNYKDGTSVFNLGVRGWAWYANGTKKFNDPDSNNYVEAGVNLSLESPRTVTAPRETFMEGTSFVAPKTNDDWNITYGNVQTLDTTSRSGNHNLFVDGVDVGTSYDRSFTPGEYTIKANSSGFPRFLPEGITKTMRVKKDTPRLNFGSNASFAPEVGEFFNLTCSSTTSQSDMELYFDGSSIDSETATDQVGNVLNASDIGRGTYTAECNSSESQNFTEKSITRQIDIQTNKPDMNFEIRPTDETRYIGMARDIFRNGQDAYIIRPDTEITVICNTIQEVGTTLEVDGVEETAPFTTTYSSLGDHTFTCTSDKTPIFDVRQEEKVLSVSNVTESSLYFDGIDDNVTVSQTEAYNLNISTELNLTNSIELWELSDPDYRDSNGDEEFDEHDDPNGTYREDNSDYPAYRDPNGSIYNARLSDLGDGRTQPSKIVPGEYRIRGVHHYTDDTYYSSETFTVTVDDTTAPRIELNMSDGETVNTSTPEIRVNTQDFSAYTCSLYYDGAVKNINAADGSGFSPRGSSFSSNQTAWGEPDDDRLVGSNGDQARIAKTAGLNLNDGGKDVRVSCEDSSGNTKSVNKELVVDTTPPRINFPNVNGGKVNNGQATDTSTPIIELSTFDGVSNDINTEIFTVKEGKIAEKTVTGQEGIQISSLSPGTYEIYAEGTDQAGLIGNTTNNDFGNGELVDLEIPSSLIYNMSPSSKNVADGRRWVNERDVNLSFKAASDDLSTFSCTTDINASAVGATTINSVSNNSQTGVEYTGLADGVYRWNASCAGGSLFKETTFTVDSTLPYYGREGVTRKSGLIATSDPTTFYIEPGDNFEVSEVNITADWLSTHPMDCDSDGLCTYQTTVPPGDYDYNYTICDAANNCETTETENYTAASEETSMELQLDGEIQNVSLDTSPIVNISSEFSNGVRGSSQFTFKRGEEFYTESGGTSLASSRDAVSTKFQQRFYENGTYTIRGYFTGTTEDGTTVQDTDWLFIDVNLTESQISDFGYQIFNLQKGNASLRNDPGFSPTIPRNGIVNTRKIILGESLGKGLAAQFTARFNKDLNAENISFNTDKSSRKSVISFESVYNQIQSHSLLVPRVEDSGKVLVCPSADNLDQIVLGCTGALNVSSGETEKGISNTEVTINGEKYYQIEGISGTGAQELSVDSGIQAPNRANVTEQEVLDEWSRSLPAEGDLDLDGGNITTADLYTEQATDHWAGIYGNATGQITLGTENLFYEWEAKPTTIFAANETVNWNTLQTSTLEQIDNYYGIAGYSDSASDTLNETTDFTVGGTNIENAPSARTYNGTQTPLWITGALNDGETPIMAGKAFNNDSTAYTGEIANYQMIVPTGGDYIVPYKIYMELE